MDVIILGGTGFIGSRLCARLIERGHDVTAAARNPGVDHLPADVDQVAVDVTQYEDLPAQIEGRDAVVNLVALSPLYTPRGGTEQYEQVIVEGTRNVVRAMEATGTERFVYQSGLGASHEAPTAYLRAKGRAEGIIRASDLTWTVTRPSVVFGDGCEVFPFLTALSTPFLTTLPSGGSQRFQPIWVEDLVTILTAIIESEDPHAERIYELGGPEVLTMAQLTRELFASAGRSVYILPLPLFFARIGLTLGDLIPLFPFGREQYRALEIDNVPATNDVDQFEIEELRSVSDYLADRNAE